jgi:hypothetical protein
MATIHLTHELIMPDAQGRKQLRRGYSSRAGRARAPRAMSGPRAQQVGHRAATPGPSRAHREQAAGPRRGASRAELHATGMGGPAGAAAPRWASKPRAGAR